MRIFFLVFFCCTVGLASAVVTPLPGSTPQRALAGDIFPNPIRLLVTDTAGNAVPGAIVKWFFPPWVYSPLWIDEPTPCTLPPLGMTYDCRVTADADGIARIDGLYAVSAGVHQLRVSGYGGAAFLGESTLELTADPRQAPLQVLPVSGEGTRAVIGTVVQGGFIARVLTAQGDPVDGAIVEFTPPGNLQTDRGFFANSSQPWVVTDSAGFARSPSFFAGWTPGVHGVEARVYDHRARAEVIARFNVAVTDAYGRLDLELTNMWWAGPLENGWGMSVVKHADQLFNVLFVYDAEGKPTWYVQPGGLFLDSNGWSFVGPLYSPRSAPWYIYDASRLVVGSRVGYLNTAFFGTERARLWFSLDMPSPSIPIKSLVVQDFTGDVASPTQGVADMWWGGESQNGWGVAILEQFGGLFLVWFTYGEDGKPTWFVMPGGAWRNASTYAGTIYRTSGTPWTSATYDASSLRVGAVGPYTLKFLDTNNAILEISVDGIARTLPITRQPF